MDLLLRNSSLLWVVVTTLKASAVLALALTVRGLMRRSAAAHRHAIVASAIGAVLALPVLSSLTPRWNIGIPWTAANVMTTRALDAPRPAVAVTASRPIERAIEQVPARHASTAVQAIATVAAPIAQATQRPSSRASVPKIAW